MFHALMYKGQYIHIKDDNISVQMFAKCFKRGFIIVDVKSMRAAKCTITRFNNYHGIEGKRYDERNI